MNFFEQQDQTKKATKRLLYLFALAIAAISMLNYIAIQIYLSINGYYPRTLHAHAERLGQGLPSLLTWFNPKLFLYTTGITIATILIVSWGKKISLRKGGKSIAQMLGGTQVAHDSQDFLEKRLLHIVEEIALASGVPVPDVFVIEEEGINAFAAGYSVDDAVIGVTRGSIESLNREELQGVIAHEFSHIFHGDMNINLHLISLLHGILFLHYIGRFILRGGGSGRSSRRRSSKNSGGLVVVGLVLMFIGYLGHFFGRLIQSAISRQREFLADASAVQYTRNPHGIANALAKIGGFGNPGQARSILHHEKTAQVEHMMFSLAVKPTWLSFFATHPPIEARIQAIDPHFDFARAKQNLSENQSSNATPGVMGLAQGGQSPKPLEKQMVIVQEQQFFQDLDPVIYHACHHPQQAKALLYLLALERGMADFDAAKRIINQRDPYILHILATIKQALTDTLFQHRIELFDLCMPSLRKLSKQDYVTFSQTLLDIVRLDQKITLSEWIFVEMVRTHLHAYFYPKRKTTGQSKAQDLTHDIRVILSATAYSGQDGQSAQLAFDKGFSLFGQPETSIIEQARLSLGDMATSFGNIQQANNKVKRKMIEAIGLVVLSDGEVTWEEFELYRAFSDGLGNPVTPRQNK